MEMNNSSFYMLSLCGTGQCTRHSVNVETALKNAASPIVPWRLDRVLDEADIVPSQIVLDVDSNICKSI